MFRTAIVLVIALCSSNFALSEEEDVDTPAARVIALEEVPAPALKAAREAKPDVFFKSAETVWWHDEFIYRIMGAKFRKDWTVYVNVQGEIFHISSDLREQ